MICYDAVYAKYGTMCHAFQLAREDQMGMWCCLDCQNLSRDTAASKASLECLSSVVCSLSNKVDSLMHMDIELLDIIQKQKTQLDTVMSDQAQHGGMLKTMYIELTQLSTVLAPASELDDSDESNEEEDVEADEVLLIRHSMIRDVLPTCDDLSVDSMTGAKFVDIKNKLKRINPRKRKIQEHYHYLWEK